MSEEHLIGRIVEEIQLSSSKERCWTERVEEELTKAGFKNNWWWSEYPGDHPDTEMEVSFNEGCIGVEEGVEEVLKVLKRIDWLESKEGPEGVVYSFILVKVLEKPVKEQEPGEKPEERTYDFSGQIVLASRMSDSRMKLELTKLLQRWMGNVLRLSVKRVE